MSKESLSFDIETLVDLTPEQTRAVNGGMSGAVTAPVVQPTATAVSSVAPPAHGTLVSSVAPPHHHHMKRYPL
jgi:hypothetical protein